MTTFADTDVVAYALDDAGPDKQRIARALLAASPRPRTRPQVLRELHVVAWSKLGLSPAAAAAAVRAVAPTVAVVEDVALVLLAVAAAERSRISLWDASIVEAARRAGAATLLSEDLQLGMDFDGVLVENPVVDR